MKNSIVLHDFSLAHRHDIVLAEFYVSLAFFFCWSEEATRWNFIHTHHWSLGWRKHIRMSSQLHHLSLISLICHF